MRVLLQRIGKCGVGRDVCCAAESPRPKFRWLVVASEGPFFQVSRGAEECDLASLQLEGYVLQRDEMLAAWERASSRSWSVAVPASMRVRTAATPCRATSYSSSATSRAACN